MRVLSVASNLMTVVLGTVGMLALLVALYQVCCSLRSFSIVFLVQWVGQLESPPFPPEVAVIAVLVLVGCVTAMFVALAMKCFPDRA